MRKTLLPLFVALLCLSGAACGQTKPGAFDYTPDYRAIGIDAARLDRIDALLEEYVADGRLPHALTFVAKDGQVIHHKAFGWRNMEEKDALEKDDIFRMYSQTKAIVSVALMNLFEQGKFQLDDPVSRYLPEMTNLVAVERVDGVVTQTREAKTPVRMRHLLSHASGINVPRGLRNSDFATLGDYVRELVKNPLMFDPGEGWYYNPSSDVMGYMVEYFSGKPLREYLKEVIFEPLGINDMDYYYDSSYASRFVNIYRPNDEGVLAPVVAWSGREPFTETAYAGGSSGLNGTIEGYARFLQMLANWGEFNGHRVLGRRTIEIMGQNQLINATRGVGNDFQFGLGFQIAPAVETGLNYISNMTPMVSPGTLHWGGAGNTDYIVDHKEGLVVLLYTNRQPDTGVWEKFLNTVYQTLE
jgi:CubicO group peptidase (beta-lactamase class C family)